jgi:hypothetical protein
MVTFSEKLKKIKTFGYYFYRIGIRFLLIRVPIFLIYLPWALLINAYKEKKFFKFLSKKDSLMHQCTVKKAQAFKISDEV